MTCSNRWWKMRCYAALVLLVTTVACKQPAEEPLRLGLLIWPPYELGYLAKDLGYLDAASIQVVDYLSPAEVVRAYRNELVDVAAVTTTYALDLANGPHGARIILAIDVSAGGDALVVRPGIESPEQLRGKRIGVERSTLGIYILDRALTQIGLTKDEITVVWVDVADQERAFDRGDVAAVITYEPTRSRLLADGAVEMFTSKQIPGEIVDVLITRQETVASKSRDLGILVDGWLRAAEYLRDHPRDALARMAPREKVSPEVLGRTFDGVRILDRNANAALLGGNPPQLLEPTKRLSKRMTELGLLKSNPPVQQLFEDRFVRGDRD